MGDLADAKTVDAAIRVLTRLGFEVSVPSSQNCCGALHLHGGDGEIAATLATGNLNAYDADTLDAIVTLASGCGGTLREYPLRMENAQTFSSKVKDISQFLADTPWPEDVTPAALEARICLHTPCTLRNVMREQSGAHKLLGKIPGIQVTRLADTTLCCGSAGSYMLEHPTMAKSLRDDVLEQVLSANPDYLASSNIGCALHLAAGLREQGKNIEVVHPVVLLDRQLRIVTGERNKQERQ
ncbi:MAG: heterodisulfide reductase-related iron-sulfur binding cluster [Pseudomonadota bacterium]